MQSQEGQSTPIKKGGKLNRVSIHFWIASLSLISVIFSWFVFRSSIFVYSNKLVYEITEFIPINFALARILYISFFSILLIISILIINKIIIFRIIGYFSLLSFLLLFYGVIALSISEYKINPITGKAMKCYVIDDGKVKYRDLVEGQEWQFDPETGKPCRPVTPELASRLILLERGTPPRRIPSDADVDLFDRSVGTPLVYYYVSDTGHVELFDKPGFHPDNGYPLNEITTEVGEQWRSQKAALLKARADEERRAQAVKEAERLAKERRKAEEARQLAEERRKAEEARQLAEERRKAEEARQLAEERRKAEEARQLAEEKRKAEEARRIAEEKRREEQRIAEEKRKAEEAEQLELARLQALGNECDRLAGNEFDRNNNKSYPSVPFQLLLANADLAVSACRKASDAVPDNMRYKYQLARALQTQGKPKAEALLKELTANNYPAAFDNLGWMYANKKQYRPAMELFRRGALLGNPEAMFSRASFLMEGKFVQKDESEALRLFLQSAQAGHPRAIAVINEIEKEQRKREDLKEGLEFFGRFFDGMTRNRN